MSRFTITKSHPRRPERVRGDRLLLAAMFACLAGLIGCQNAAVSEPEAPDSVAESTVESTSIAPQETRAAHADSRRDFPLGRPVLLDLGATRCLACQMMEPVLEELGEEYAGVMEVVFIDVFEDGEAGSRYGIESIPTQIFFNAEGKELFRHVGFISKEDILAKWKELGVDLPEKGSPASAG